MEDISSYVSDEDLVYSWFDEYGVRYSLDGKKQLLGNSKLRSYTVREGTEVICDEAFDFSSFSILREIEIPDTVVSIGDCAFQYCNDMQKVTIPESVKNIGKRAFCGCESLRNLTIPASVTSIGDGAFSDCSMQMEVKSSKFHSDGTCLYEVDTQRLMCCHRMAAEMYIIPDGVTCIGDEAFLECINLQSITIPGTVTRIGNAAFSKCLSMKSISIPETVTSIGSWAFAYCFSLQNIILPDSLTRIEDGTFYGCSIKNITLPASVTSICEDALGECKSLREIFIPAGFRAHFAALLPEYKDKLVEIDEI